MCVVVFLKISSHMNVEQLMQWRVAFATQCNQSISGMHDLFIAVLLSSKG